MKNRHTIAATVAALAFASIAMGADSCSTETTNEADAPSSANDAAPEKAKRPAKVGSSITLDGNETKMKVTVLKVVDPVQVGEFDQPTSGSRYVGVQVLLKNVGDAGYDDSPSNGAELILSDDSQAQGAIVTDGDCAADFSASAKIGPDSQQQGCLPFEVKSGLRPKTFQFTLDSGFGPQAGEWRLR